MRDLIYLLGFNYLSVLSAYCLSVHHNTSLNIYESLVSLGKESNPYSVISPDIQVLRPSASDKTDGILVVGLSVCGQNI